MATKGKAKKHAKSAAKVAGAATTTDKLYRTSAVYKSPRKISVANLPSSYSRADLEFIGVDHSGASYEARVYLNNPSADADTQAVEANGYAGSYYIFGHGGCFGDIGHCEIQQARDEFDPRPSSPLEPIKKVVMATDALKKATAQSSEISVTVVPIIMSWTEKTDMTDIMKFDHINLVTYE
jgi:tyrosinase